MRMPCSLQYARLSNACFHFTRELVLLYCDVDLRAVEIEHLAAVNHAPRCMNGIRRRCKQCHMFDRVECAARAKKRQELGGKPQLRAAHMDDELWERCCIQHELGTGTADRVGRCPHSRTQL